MLGYRLDAASGFGGRKEAVLLHTAERSRHLYVLGATGSGKTNLLLRLIECDIAAGRTLCLIDLRGDLVDRALLRLAAAGSPNTWQGSLCLIDLRSNDNLAGFNPLKGSGDVYMRALHLLGVLRKNSDSWGVQLEETLRNALVALTEAGLSLLEIEPLLTNAGFRAHVLQQVSDPYVMSFFQRFSQLSEDRRSAWVLPVLNKVTSFVAIPRLRLLLGSDRPVNLAQLLDRPGQIILISLAVDRLHQAAHLIGGLFVSAIQSAIMARVDQPEYARRPVHLYIDEFETMATETFEAILAEGRRFGLCLTLAHQHLSQLPPGLRHALRNNVHTQIYFQTGSLDAKELTHEIVSFESADAVRQTLMTQQVGEAFVVRRESEPVQIRTPYAPDPKVDAEVVERIRQASLATYARPRAQVEKELRERSEWIDRLCLHKRADSQIKMEVRHDKLPGSFKAYGS